MEAPADGGAADAGAGQEGGASPALGSTQPEAAVSGAGAAAPAAASDCTAVHRAARPSGARKHRPDASAAVDAAGAPRGADGGAGGRSPAKSRAPRGREASQHRVRLQEPPAGQGSPAGPGGRRQPEAEQSHASRVSEPAGPSPYCQVLRPHRQAPPAWAEGQQRSPSPVRHGSPQPGFGGTWMVAGDTGRGAAARRSPVHRDGGEREGSSPRRTSAAELQLQNSPYTQRFAAQSLAAGSDGAPGAALTPLEARLQQRKSNGAPGQGRFGVAQRLKQVDKIIQNSRTLGKLALLKLLRQLVVAADVTADPLPVATLFASRKYYFAALRVAFSNQVAIPEVLDQIQASLAATYPGGVMPAAAPAAAAAAALNEADDAGPLPKVPPRAGSSALGLARASSQLPLGPPPLDWFWPNSDKDLFLTEIISAPMFADPAIMADYKKATARAAATHAFRISKAHVTASGGSGGNASPGKRPSVPLSLTSSVGAAMSFNAAEAERAGATATAERDLVVKVVQDFQQAQCRPDLGFAAATAQRAAAAAARAAAAAVAVQGSGAAKMARLDSKQRVSGTGSDAAA